MSGLANQLVVAEREEVARGIRMLLASPLLGERTAPEAFDLVRRRRGPITQWFEYYCGWQLIVEPRLGYARLVKVGVATDPSRPARRLRSEGRRSTAGGTCCSAWSPPSCSTVPVTTIGMLADRVASRDGRPTGARRVRTGQAGRADGLRRRPAAAGDLGVLEVVDGTHRCVRGVRDRPRCCTGSTRPC